MAFLKHSVLLAGLLLAGAVGVGTGAQAQDEEPEAEAEPEKSPEQMENELAEQERAKAEQARLRTPEALAPRLKQMEEISAKLKVERERRQKEAARTAEAQPQAQAPDTRPEEERVIEESEKILRTNEKLLLNKDNEKNPAWYVARAEYGVTTGREAIANARRVKLQKLWSNVLEQPAAIAELREHGQRLAVLKRIQLVAEVKRYPKTVTRAASLIERETKRHLAAMEQLRDAGKPAEPAANKPAEPGVVQ